MFRLCGDRGKDPFAPTQEGIDLLVISARNNFLRVCISDLNFLVAVRASCIWLSAPFDTRKTYITPCRINRSRGTRIVHGGHLIIDRRTCLLGHDAGAFGG